VVVCGQLGSRWQQDSCALLISAGASLPPLPFGALCLLDRRRRLARLCLLRSVNHLPTKLRRSYDIKRELPIRRVLAGIYPCVVRKVRFDCRYDWLSLVPKLPSTVTSMSVFDLKINRWRVSDLLRSLTHFSIDCRPLHSALLASVTAAEDWPPGLTSLQLDVFGELPPLPSSLRAFESQHLIVDGGRLPDSLTTLRLGAAHNKLWFHLPPHLTILEMRLSSNTTTEHLAHLPASLTHLALLGGHHVHKCFRADTAEPARLPAGLRYLRLESVPYRAFRDLPSSLEHLIVKNAWHSIEPWDFWGFDGPIRHASLQTLELPCGFSFPIAANHLPSLRELSLSRGFDQSLHDLPSSLRNLKLMEGGVKQPLDSLPAYLAELDLRGSLFNNSLDRLPHRLISLTLGRDFHQPLDALPSGLTRLDFSKAWRFNRPLDNLPESLQVLILPEMFDQPLQQLPSSLRKLQFHPFCPFNRPLPPLPDSLSVLSLGNAFSQPLQRLPCGLTDLQFGHAFNHPLPLKPEPSNEEEQESSSSPSIHSSAADVDSQESKAMTYPVALRSLQLGYCFNQALSLPPSLTSLSIYSSRVIDPILAMSSLPTTLTFLGLPDNYKRKAGVVAAVRARCPFLLIGEYAYSR